MTSLRASLSHRYAGITTELDLLTSTEVIFDFMVNSLLVRLAVKELAQYLHIRCNYGTSIPYVTNIWNMLEVMNITPFIFAWMTRIGFVLDQNRVLYKAGMFATRYAEISTTALSYAMGFNFDSISISVSFFKLFKYFRLSPQFALLWNVLERGAIDMISFGFMLLMFLVAFAVFAEQYFGLTLPYFSDTIRSLTTLLTMIFGVVDIYWEMVRSQSPGIFQMTAIIFFIGYTTWMFFIFVNVFLAILNDAYGSVKSELEEEKEARRIEKEERLASGLETKGGITQRLSIAQRAARGRMQRFQGQLKRLAKRKQEHQTSNDVVAAGTALGLSYEEIEKLDKEGRKRKRRMGSLKVLPRKFGLPRRRR